MDVSFFQEILTKISDRGRQILDLSFIGGGEQESIESLCQALTSSRGEAMGVALARNILDRYLSFEDSEKSTFFAFLARDLRPKSDNIFRAAKAYLDGFQCIEFASAEVATPASPIPPAPMLERIS